MVVKLNNTLKILIAYTKLHWIYGVVGGYFILSVILFSYFKINIAIPCLIRLTTGLECPGCGLTHALAHLIRLEFSEAWSDNKLIFVILPAGLYYFLNDIKSFRKTIPATE
jgi:hypothetical protein